MEKINCFQVYSNSSQNRVSFLVDKIWIKNKRIFFRVVDTLSLKTSHLRKEKGKNVYSIDESEIYTIRCRLYF